MKLQNTLALTSAVLFSYAEATGSSTKTAPDIQTPTVTAQTKNQHHELSQEIFAKKSPLTERQIKFVNDFPNATEAIDRLSNHLQDLISGNKKTVGSPAKKFIMDIYRAFAQDLFDSTDIDKETYDSLNKIEDVNQLYEATRCLLAQHALDLELSPQILKVGKIDTAKIDFVYISVAVYQMQELKVSFDLEKLQERIDWNSDFQIATYAVDTPLFSTTLAKSPVASFIKDGNDIAIILSLPSINNGVIVEKITLEQAQMDLSLNLLSDIQTKEIFANQELLKILTEAKISYQMLAGIRRDLNYMLSLPEDATWLNNCFTGNGFGRELTQQFVIKALEGEKGYRSRVLREARGPDSDEERKISLDLEPADLPRLCRKITDRIKAWFEKLQKETPKTKNIPPI